MRLKINKKDRKCISIYTSVYKRLKKRGLFGESFSDLISKILDKVESLENSSEMDNIK